MVLPPILGLDQGTTGCTAIVFGADRTVLGRGDRAVPQHFPAPGWVEHDAEDLFALSVEAMREAIAAAGVMPVALGIANQRETILLWDRKTLLPVSPAIVWQDRRTTARCRELVEAGHARMLRERTGLLPDPYFSATKLEWLLRDPGLHRRAVLGELCAGTVDSWLVARLTDGRQHVTDPTNASRTMLFDHNGAIWHDELLALFDVPRAILPRIVPSAGRIGDIAASHLGHALPIAGLAGDQQAALFGLGCVQPGQTKCTYGTGAFALSYAGEVWPGAPEGLLVTSAITASGGRAFAVEGSVLAAGAALQWLRDGLGIIADPVESAALARSVADTGGVTVVPAFAGLATPHWEPEARGTIVGITGGTTRAHLVRAVLEGIACSVTELLRAMPTPQGRAQPLLVDGGLAGNDWLMQCQADLLGVAIQRPTLVESTCFGAAALAGLGMGAWPAPVNAADEWASSTFTPVIDRRARDQRMKEWARAVRAARAWVPKG
jgi:glycerol kinase